MKTPRMFITMGTQALCYKTDQNKYYFNRDPRPLDKFMFTRDEVQEAEKYFGITGLVDKWDEKYDDQARESEMLKLFTDGLTIAETEAAMKIINM